jgi:DNA invertase Pin-like site-specific DNA recombinase
MAADKKLALVVRVSDVKGRDKKGDRFISPELQIATATGYAAGRGYAVKKFEDLNVSHTTPLDTRPGMGEALRLIESGKLAGLIVSSQDRLGPLDITRELKTRLVAADAILLVPDNPGIENIAARGYAKLPGENMALMHEAQREEIGLRWAKAKHSAFERGVYAGAAPAGYSKVDGKLVPDGNGKAAAIREAFETRADGGSYGAMAKVLTDASVETCHKVKGTDKKRTTWAPMGARSILQNDVYLGVFTCTCGCGQTKEDTKLALIDRALWLRANRKGETKRKGSKGDGEGQMLNGLLKCATCGYGMSADTSKHGGKVYRYWRCKSNPECSAKAIISADKVEPWIVTQVLEHVGTVHGEDGGTDEARVAELRAGLAKAEADITGLGAMVDSGEVDAMTFARANAAAVKTRDTLAVELSEIEIETVATKWYVPGPGDRDYIEGGEHTTAAVFARMPVSVQRQALGTVISRAVVAPGKGEAYERIEVEWT